MAFDSLIGNEKVKLLLNNSIKSQEVLHSYLFTGIEGIGKRLFAKEFANMILCSSKSDEKPCGNCKSCMEFNGNSHPDFLQIEPEDGKSIKIEQIRYLQEKLAQKPITSNKKVCIINDCDTMTIEASNSLLKTLEEPPTYVTIILITANESKMLVTIKSRCTKIAFNALSEEDIQSYIKKEQLANEGKIKKESIESIIKQCQGSIGRLLKITQEQDNYIEVENVVNNLEKLDITQIWKKSEILYQAKEKIIDLLDYMNVIFFEKLKMQKDMKYSNAISIIEETKKRIMGNSNYDMTIDNLLLKLWEEFR